MIIMPGYCVAGTVGHKILNGTRKLEFKKGKIVDVKMSVQYMSFSAHADAKGIMQLISYCQPRHVMLVHGEAVKMEFLQQKIKQEHGIECFMPANGETVKVPTKVSLRVAVDKGLMDGVNSRYNEKYPDPNRPRVMHGVLVMREKGDMQIISVEAACAEFKIPRHTVSE